MMLKQYLLSALLVGAVSVTAAQKSAEDVIKAIMPASASCPRASESSKECRTAAQAAPFLVQAFQKYEIYDWHEISAVLALIAIESVELQFNTNQSPGRPGQGTHNMMLINYVREYIQSIPELDSEWKKTLELDQNANDTMNAQRALVLDDKYSFASGAWFLNSKHCNKTRAGLREGTTAGWEAYTLCVVNGDTVDPARTAYWTKALTAWN